MIKLVENNKEAALVLEHLSLDTAPLLASKMFTEGFGVNQDFLQFYAAFNDSGKLCASFVKCNDRVFCLIDTLYDEEEISLFLNGFKDFKIFLKSDYAHIVDRKDFNYCLLMKKRSFTEKNEIKTEKIDSKLFTEIIMKGKPRDFSIRFLLNNSHLLRHGYLKNYASINNGDVLSIASLYSDKGFCYLCNVFTPEDKRHKGFASDLINEISNTDKECHLICSEEVSPLYERCGFKPYAKWVEYLY